MIYTLLLGAYLLFRLMSINIIITRIFNFNLIIINQVEHSDFLRFLLITYSIPMLNK